ncbi:hypothetical protein VA249_46100 (plasmid) [Vibrio alfacsensis]|uniref:hypothetical protein n=1 Tax=Vibrio alfacsensis TaxID=1074311 RepID=UPI001BEE09B2|nr:hypothetical protein [Vibrio alfacsensis]BBM67964.1 hypothetical protein VA249_46100 [Vibrio alfacsensis]
MNEKYIRALITLTRSTSEPTLNAAIEHICLGESQAKSAVKHGVKQEAVARLSKRIKELDKQVTDIIKLKK